MKTWRLLDLEYQNPYLNMAVEEAILLTAEKGTMWNTLRFWRNSNAVVLGSFQSVVLEVNLVPCMRHATAIVRRLTGGGTVYHDYGNLNWTVVMRKNHQWASKDIFKVFEVCSKPIVEALRILGVNANFNAPNAILVNNKKVSGMAAYSKRATILCHGTLLVNTNLNILNEILRVQHKETCVGTCNRLRSKHMEVTSLRQELRPDGGKIPMSTIKELLAESFQRIFRVKLEKRGLEVEEEKLANRLYKSKYSLAKWNFGNF